MALTPAPGGGEELLNEYLSSVAPSLYLKDWDIWHAEKICRLLDTHTAVRQRYLGHVMGDLLATLTETLSAEQAELADTLSSHLAKTFKAEKYAQLDQGGGVDDRKVPLARVFVDVPYQESDQDQEFIFEEEEQDSDGKASTAHLIELTDKRATPVDREIDASRGRFIVIGGPGQGKSTLGRFLCQIYRSELLSRHQFLSLQPEIRAEISYTRQLCQEEGITLPNNLRFPFFVSLPKFANFLAKESQSSLIQFIAQRIGDGFTTAGVRRWLRQYPWLLVLDGLDEVPTSANRDVMLQAVSTFHDSADACGADLVVIATSRPQGYKDEFSSYYRMILSGLKRDQALRYSRRLTSIRHGEGSEKSTEIMGRVEKAANSTETARLMTTPLQVTILVLLLSRSSRAPSQRYALFSNYYQVIYARELEKDTPSAQVLDRFRSFVDLLHWRIGLRLQYEAAKASHTEASLTREEVALELKEMLRSEGYEEPELSERAAEIMDSAADRLVFLVAGTAERFGFELRSLQEFCAAQGLLEGNDEDVYQRLAAISCSDHWRNVFQLASGAIFSTNSARRDMIVSICAELNSGDIPDFPGSGAARLGSQLAIDILGDRIADTAPRHQRLLTEIAVSVIAVPARNSFSLLRLVQFTDAASRAKLDLALNQARDSSNLYECAGALVNMAAQAELDKETSMGQFVASLQAQSRDTKVKILRIALSANPGRFAAAWVLLDRIMDFTPAEVWPLINRLPVSTWNITEDVLETEITPAGRLIPKLGRNIRDLRLNLQGKSYVEVKVSLIRQQGGSESDGDYLSSTATDAKLAGPMNQWEFLRQAAIFADNPGPDTWDAAAVALMQADEEDVRTWWTRIPWPLAVWWETGREPIEVTPDIVSEWQMAQQSWSDEKAAEDIFIVQPRLVPNVTGIPASLIRHLPRSGRLSYSPSNLAEVATELAQAPQNRFWNTRVSWFWNTVSHIRGGAHIVAELSVDTCTTLAKSSAIIPTELITELAARGDAASALRADQLGRMAHGLSSSSRKSFDPSVPGAYETWVSNKSSWGLARALVRCPPLQVESSWQDVKYLADDDAGMFEKFVVVWGGHWREEDEQDIAQYLYEHARGVQTVPINTFDKFICGRGGAKLAEILRTHQDPRYTSLVNIISYRHSTRIVSIPHPTFRLT
ncbi:NACHT domain-containing protein [Streptomyces hirsutus]|uniref:NACHT domain-containing protein n=1 Tax=Streptomyces hirsutus TaxID=35620 RepID=UPI00369DF053